MKKYWLIATLLLLQGCASNFLVNQANASNALRYEAIADLPKKEVIGQMAYLGGQIVTIDRAKRQIELVARHINASGYPEAGTNQQNARIFVNIPMSVQINFYDLTIGDRLAALGPVKEAQSLDIAGNPMTIVEMTADDYRTWTNQRFEPWDDDPWLWGPRFGPRYYRPWYN
ncbi:hypothetical protein B9T21_05570 [Wohlfahrtiimonas chitiniclastica]|uniref:Slp family lipoprotein n=1 Tax=Wohlfahrtiimonas chitiniclastica TaxID=400946 RepID=UPI000B997386|nr:Slp family lipoprotein [Wohlfahrtiimonas chitiniclastica]OYQ87726.1 hypothetical protein B9T21_05570 [Wohlfahrtiimonas chitiniclastica]